MSLQVDNSTPEQRVSSLEYDRSEFEADTGAIHQSHPVPEAVNPTLIGNGQVVMDGRKTEEHTIFTTPRRQQNSPDEFSPENSLLADLVTRMGGLDVVTDVSKSKTDQETLKKL